MSYRHETIFSPEFWLLRIILNRIKFLVLKHPHYSSTYFELGNSTNKQTDYYFEAVLASCIWRAMRPVNLRERQNPGVAKNENQREKITGINLISPVGRCSKAGNWWAFKPSASECIERMTRISAWIYSRKSATSQSSYHQCMCLLSMASRPLKFDAKRGWPRPWANLYWDLSKNWCVTQPKHGRLRPVKLSPQPDAADTPPPSIPCTAL